MIKFQIKKILQANKDTIKNETNIIVNNIIKDNNIDLAKVLTIYDNYRDIIKNMNITNNDDINYLNDELDKNLVNIINEKLTDGQNNKLLEKYYKELPQENKKYFKDKIVDNLSNQTRGKLDLITFGDII